LRPLSGITVDAGADRFPCLGGGLDRSLLVKMPEDFVLALDLAAQGGADGAICEMGSDLGGERLAEFAVKKIFKLISATFAIHNRSAKPLARARRRHCAARIERYGEMRFRISSLARCRSVFNLPIEWPVIALISS
jgi:hypothetical protein